MRRIGSFLVATGMMLSLVACGAPQTNTDTASEAEPETTQIAKQSASAYLDQEGTTIEATVDLTGGWSVEFVRGAMYLYDTEIADGVDATAIGVTLDKDVYKEDLAEAIASKEHKEADGGIYYTRNDGEQCFICSVEDSAYFLLTTKNENIHDIWTRINLAIDR